MDRVDFTDTEKWTPIAHADFMDLAYSCEEGEIRINKTDGSIGLFLNDALMAATIVNDAGDRVSFVK